MRCLNYIWVIGKLSHLSAIVGGVMIIITDINFLMGGIDIIIINMIVLLFSLILVKKTGDAWQSLKDRGD